MRIKTYNKYLLQEQLKAVEKLFNYYLINFVIDGIIATAKAILNNSLGKKGYKPPANALS